MFPISFGVCPSQELEIDLRVGEKPHDVELEVMELDIVDSSIGSWRRRNFFCMTTPIFGDFVVHRSCTFMDFP